MLVSKNVFIHVHLELLLRCFTTLMQRGMDVMAL